MRRKRLEKERDVLDHAECGGEDSSGETGIFVALYIYREKYSPRKLIYRILLII